MEWIKGSKADFVEETIFIQDLKDVDLKQAKDNIKENDEKGNIKGIKNVIEDMLSEVVTWQKQWRLTACSMLHKATGFCMRHSWLY